MSRLRRSPPRIEGRVLLASRSPRRRELLERAGAEVTVVAPAIDDTGAEFGEGSPRRLVGSLAWFKAAQILADPATLEARLRSRWIIAADTVCSDGERIIGKPADAEEARWMIERFMERDHRVLTGVCVVDPRTDQRRLFVDEAIVSLGRVPEALLRAHLSQGGWRGRAGGYNYAEVRDAGWPIECRGDETTVMGLPMTRLAMLLGASQAEARHCREGGPP